MVFRTRMPVVEFITCFNFKKNALYDKNNQSIVLIKEKYNVPITVQRYVILISSKLKINLNVNSTRFFFLYNFYSFLKLKNFN